MATRLGKRQIKVLQSVKDHPVDWSKDFISSSEYTILERLEALGYIRLRTTTRAVHFSITDAGREALKAATS